MKNAWMTFILLVLVGCQKQKVEAPVVEPEPVKAEIKSVVATLAQFQPAVDFRRSEELNWSSVSDHVPFYNFDSLRTADSAWARVEFNDKTFLQVKANSLVVILDKKVMADAEESSASLKSGLAEAEILPSETKRNELLLKTRTVWIRAVKKPGDKIKSVVRTEFKPDGAVAVTAKQGDVQLISVEKVQTLPSGQTATVTTTEPVPEAVTKEQEKTAEPPRKIVIQLNKDSEKKPYFFKMTSQVQKNKNGVHSVEVSAECEPGYTAYFKNRPVSDNKGHIFFKAPLKKGGNSLSLMLVNENAKDVKYESIEVETRD